MRSRLMAAAGGLLLVLGGACAPSFDIKTVVSPSASIGDLHTFRLLPVPPRRDGRGPTGAYDPMVNNSITNRALRETLAAAFTRRGYAVSEGAPDFLVAVYASAREKLDIEQWDYGYPIRPRRWPAYETVTVTEYTEGTVVVDVIDAKSRDLLWRGTGASRMSERPDEDVRELQEVAKSIVKRFPRAAQPTLAVVP